ncbi:MAG: acyltransferase family protein [Akkermansia sp.]
MVDLRISLQLSQFLKGMAVLLMVYYHLAGTYLPIRGASCVAIFALVTGYAQALKSEDRCFRDSMKEVAKQYQRFYRRYLLCLLVCAPLLHVSCRVFLETLIPLFPNALADSWWYAFCYTFLVFVAFPVMWLCQHRISERFVVPVQCGIAIGCMLIPVVASHLGFPGVLTQVWGCVPLLRTLMFTPYYIFGFVYCSVLRDQKYEKIAYLLVALCAIVYFPFSWYDIDGIRAVNVGRAFCLVIVVSLLLYRFRPARIGGVFLGKLSLYIWLFHMPLHSLLMSNLHYRGLHSSLKFTVTFALSTVIAYAIAWVLALRKGKKVLIG